jgi:hypothetical protein
VLSDRHVEKGVLLQRIVDGQETSHPTGIWLGCLRLYHSIEPEDHHLPQRWQQSLIHSSKSKTLCVAQIVRKSTRGFWQEKRQPQPKVVVGSFLTLPFAQVDDRTWAVRRDGAKYGDVGQAYNDRATWSWQAFWRWRRCGNARLEKRGRLRCAV